MNVRYILISILFGNLCAMQAQFEDNMEYPSNEACADWWTTWDNGTCPDFVVGSPGEKIGYIPGDLTTNPVLNLGNKIFGEYGLEFDMYISGGKEAYYSLQGYLPIDGGQWSVGSFHFNQDNASPGQGIITDTALGAVVFDFPHDEWFHVVMNFELIEFNTWSMSVNEEIVIPPGTWFTNGNGDFPSSLGGIDFSSITTNHDLFVDNFNYINEQLPLGVHDNPDVQFVLYPNPGNNVIHIDSREVLEGVKFYSMQGKLVLETTVTAVDVSTLSVGMYFIEVHSGTKKSVKKFIKQ
ncbi:MAG: T9SS type A sorting domain-containing protein [Bacteroidetes bacterium]|nr:T9SS type A sorting domain-containing protein [Bacteroidota bacterium]